MTDEKDELEEIYEDMRINLQTDILRMKDEIPALQSHSIKMNAQNIQLQTAQTASTFKLLDTQNTLLTTQQQIVLMRKEVAAMHIKTDKMQLEIARLQKGNLEMQDWRKRAARYKAQAEAGQTHHPPSHSPPKRKQMSTPLSARNVPPIDFMGSIEMIDENATYIPLRDRIATRETTNAPRVIPKSFDPQPVYRYSSLAKSPTKMSEFIKPIVKSQRSFGALPSKLNRQNTLDAFVKKK